MPQGSLALYRRHQTRLQTLGGIGVEGVRTLASALLHASWIDAPTCPRLKPAT